MVKLTETGSIELRTMGIGRMSELSEQSFDFAAAVLVFSELSQGERSYALKHTFRVLKPHGRLFITDEVLPGGWECENRLPGRTR